MDDRMAGRSSSLARDTSAARGESSAARPGTRELVTVVPKEVTRTVQAKKQSWRGVCKRGSLMLPKVPYDGGRVWCCRVRRAHASNKVLAWAKTSYKSIPQGKVVWS